MFNSDNVWLLIIENSIIVILILIIYLKIVSLRRK